MRSENRGKAAALNLGIAHATGDYVWIVDDDDLPYDFALEHLLAHVQSNNEPAFVYARHNRFEDRPGGRVWFDQGYWADCTPDDFHIATMEDFFAHQPGMLVAKCARAG